MIPDVICLAYSVCSVGIGFFALTQGFVGLLAKPRKHIIDFLKLDLASILHPLQNMSSPFAQRYLPLRQQEAADGSGKEDSTGRASFEDVELQSGGPLAGQKASAWAMRCRGLPFLLIICLLLSNTYTWTKLRASAISNPIYSPAESAIRHKNVRFAAGVKDDKSPYQGPPNEENNRLWEDLYQFGVDRIPTSEAVKLDSPTSPIPNDPDHWVMILDVFHQLHCLNIIRKHVYWNSSEPMDQKLNMVHVDHCIDQLRQSLTCSSDITPIPYAWYPQYQSTLPMTGVTHTCRDFDAVRDWAKDRRTPKFDSSIHMKNPFGDVVHVFGPTKDS